MDPSGMAGMDMDMRNTSEKHVERGLVLIKL